jgi:uncharacterized protein GlcG (DUF336 family)
MDGAKVTSINTAMDMAFTAAGNRIPTSACKSPTRLLSLYISTDTTPDQENSWPGSATSGIGNTISGRFCTLGGGVPIFCPSGNGDILGAIGCSTGTSHQDEAAAKAGRDAVIALIRKEKIDEERRVENERQAVLTLWKEKEEEVGTLREELERGSKRIRLDEFSGRKGSIALSNCGSLSGRSGMGVAPDTPPEEGEIHPSFVGEVSLGRV